MKITHFLFCMYVLHHTTCQQGRLRFSQYLDRNGDVLLSWDLNSSTDEITIELVVNTTGWIGFGLSKNGAMNGADIVIGGVKNNSTYFSDAHGIGQMQPEVDKIQNYNLLSLTEDNNSTCMRVRRKLQTCDSNDVDITADTIKVIYAFGSNDVVSYHGNRRGAKSVIFLQNQIQSLSSDNETLFFDLKIQNFSVFPRETVYGCLFVDLLNVTQKHHIYKIEPIIQPGNEDVVHHLVLYGCSNASVTRKPQGDCTYSEYTSLICAHVITAWAYGGEAFRFPENTGISIGTNRDFKVAVLEVHYNNPHLKSGIKDSSGIRFYYTPELRKYDVGVLAVGPTVYPTFFIPPKMKSFKMYGICKTEKFVELNQNNVGDMIIFASLPHTHLTGRAVKCALYRNGSQIGFLSRDDNYDFSFQATRFFTPYVTLKMGDQIVTECTYNTMDRKNVTFSGMGTMDEMCTGFFYYYPKNSVSSCNSFYDSDYIARAVGYNGTGLQSVYPWANSVEWDEWKGNKVENATKEGIHSIFIIAENGVALDFGKVVQIDDRIISTCKSTSSDGATTEQSRTVSSPNYGIFWAPLFSLFNHLGISLVLSLVAIPQIF
ncbi:putative DBH-like monooxygenase protein 2 [Protopterus annectens]|uniref:putative DBH-like monooxygenase protein 2 n=1 Tax=Protopterus annectens TaxID=7888 RepID=UPI001CFB3AD1|nr:putative DBH-like monooxygenase protein 2 [Protopterus annectens]